MRVCVFCGSSSGGKREYEDAAANVGRLLAERGHCVVYGGGDRGLMGSLARAALQSGGEVIGVIPEVLVGREGTSGLVSDLRITPGMHERKSLMYKLASAFLVLPGGLGTLDEVVETLTWAQLGIQRKPIAFLDVAGYFTPLFGLLEHAIREGFIAPEQRALLRVCSEPSGLIELLSL